ncbi:MFS transporter [Pseudosporangium ferrugineum]|uniref:Putative MFS family arabinose efflux permease n=1 Tax=Pseudosporangium ferrugineum TaxID=439699 RepID=A0A2T0RC77_9ACTN|nr:MFS transporter [Pseudosporangium ferrugineum]PRY18768.1 putative MFS family arabinose efflux permease [Pseudosporangium ferrugineum]
MTDAPGTLWRNREFNLLWVSQSLSDAGTAISALAVPLLLLTLTSSPVRAGLVSTIGLVVTVLSRLPAGVLADRFDRRRIMLVCDAVRLVAYLILGLAVWHGRPSLVLVIAVVVVGAAGNAFFGTAEHSSLRTIVAPGQLPAAVARNEARSYGTSLAGPPLGGLLFGLGHALPFFGDAVTFLASMAGVARVRRPLQQRREAGRGGHVAALAEGFRFVFGNAFLRAVLVVAAPLNLAIHGITFTIIVTLQANRVPPAIIGAVSTVVAAGGLLGALAAPSLHRRLPLPVLIRGISWAAALLMSTSALLTGSVAAAVPVALALFLGPTANAALFGHQAAITPDRLQGRVVSVIIVVATSVSATAPLLAGVLIAVFGPVPTVLAFAALVGGSAVVTSTGRGIRTMEPVE